MRQFPAKKKGVWTMSKRANFIGTDSIVRGDTKTFNLVFTNTSGVAIDITGYTLFLTLKENITDLDDDAALKKTIAPADLDNPTTGIQDIAIDAGDTDDMLGDYYYDIQVKTAGDKIYTLLYGTITIVADTTLRAS